MKRRAGFTLIETMLAVAIFGVLMALLSNTLTNFYRTWIGEYEKQGAAARLARVYKSIDDDLTKTSYNYVYAYNRTHFLDGQNVINPHNYRWIMFPISANEVGSDGYPRWNKLIIYVLQEQGNKIEVDSGGIFNNGGHNLKKGSYTNNGGGLGGGNTQLHPWSLNAFGARFIKQSVNEKLMATGELATDTRLLASLGYPVKRQVPLYKLMRYDLKITTSTRTAENNSISFHNDMLDYRAVLQSILNNDGRFLPGGTYTLPHARKPFTFHNAKRIESDILDLDIDLSSDMKAHFSVAMIRIKEYIKHKQQPERFMDVMEWVTVTNNI